MEITKLIRFHQEEKTAGNTMYKKIQNTYRTRKILPCKASILPMEWRRWHIINIQKLPWFIHKQTRYYTSECTKIQWRMCSIWYRPAIFGKQYTTVCMGNGCSKHCTRWYNYKCPRFLHITKSRTSKRRYNKYSESWQHATYNRYTVYVVCKSSKKARYESSCLLHTHT